MADGYPDAATRQLEQVVTLMPNDAVAANLLKMTAAQHASSNPDSVAQPTPEPPTGLPPLNDTPVAPIDTNSIAGNWKAKRDDGSRFSLTLTGEKTFRWSYQPNSQPEQAFDGTYSVDGNVLALERSGGGSLVAEITANNGQQFNFKMVGAPQEDPGLTFVR